MNKSIVKNVIFPIHERIIGRKTYEYLYELDKLQWASPDALYSLRFEKLKALLLHAQKNIPFYAERFAQWSFNPMAIDCIDDFKSIPILSKAEIRPNLQRMLWKECPGGLHRYNTGGSSGEPLIFYFDRRRQAYDAAARALTHKWWDIDIGDRELYLWGSPIEISKQDKIKTLRDIITNQLLISAFEISPQRIPEFVAKLKKFKPQCIFGYPSTIDLFCRMAKMQNFRFDQIGVKVVFTTAEVLFEYQRQNISRCFGDIPVADMYGSREGGFICHQCREGTYHVIDPNYIIEYIKDGESIKPGQEGEIVITHLDAWGMPLIRYRTGDVALLGEGQCKCGRSFSTITQVRGRTTDFIVTPDGRWQHALSIIYVVRDIEGVVNFKIIQNDFDDIRVLLKIDDSLYPVDGNQRIIKGFRKRMGEQVRIRIDIETDLPNDPSGKYRYVISKVAQQVTSN